MSGAVAGGSEEAMAHGRLMSVQRRDCQQKRIENCISRELGILVVWVVKDT